MDVKELSKKKYIWVYYKDKESMIHKQRYPVIYSNLTVVYYKEHENPYLQSIAQPRITRSEEVLKEAIEHVLADTHTRGVCHSWIDLDITEYQTNAREIARQAKIVQLRRALEYKKKDYETALTKLRELEEESNE